MLFCFLSFPKVISSAEKCVSKAYDGLAQALDSTSGGNKRRSSEE